jgi:IS30 family transposase
MCPFYRGRIIVFEQFNKWMSYLFSTFSWQRGLNENTNRLLLQYWPNPTDFKKVSDFDVKEVLVRLNSRPRKKLTFKTTAELMGKHMAALAA